MALDILLYSARWCAESSKESVPQLLMSTNCVQYVNLSCIARLLCFPF